MKSSSPPPPPDPQKTANAQTKSNIETAAATQSLNMVNQSTPYWNLTYSGPDDVNWRNIKPGDYTATMTLSPEEMAKQQQQWEFDSLVNKFGIDQTKKLSSLLSEPLNLNNEATEARLFELGRKRLDPMFAERRNAMEAKLYNQGVMPGTEAWAREFGGFSGGGENIGSIQMAENDAINQLLLSGRGQAIQEALTQRSQPINEITALMSGGQVQSPDFRSTPTTNVAGTDVSGLIMDAYKYGPLAQWNAEQQQRNAMMSGLFGMGGAALGGWASGGFKW